MIKINFKKQLILLIAAIPLLYIFTYKKPFETEKYTGKTITITGKVEQVIIEPSELFDDSVYTRIILTNDTNNYWIKGPKIIPLTKRQIISFVIPENVSDSNIPVIKVLNGK